MLSGNTRYIDVTDYDIDMVKMLLLSNNECDTKTVLLYMPDINYRAMHELEELAPSGNFALLTIPITLPLMDIAKQMEYAGIEVSNELLFQLRYGIRKMIVEILSKEG